MMRVSLLDGTHESDELVWNNPVEVAVLDSLIVLILLDVETLKIVPSELDSTFESLQAVEHGAIIEAVTLRGISVRFEQLVVGSELLKCFFG